MSQAAQEGRTMYLKGVKAPAGNCLKKGSGNKKLGFIVKKGRHRGKRIYSLTLQERATCPTSCHHWIDCYGNNMPFAHRFDHGPDLVESLKLEIPTLLKKHSIGVLVRLHVLGDFYSVGYIGFWRKMLNLYSTLAVFGYTARSTGKMGEAIRRINEHDNCNIRFSRNEEFNGVDSFAATEEFSGAGIDCPEQTGKTDSCANCALCWGIDATIRFYTH